MRAQEGDFARFASELQQIRSQLMDKFWEPEDFIERSGIENTADMQHAMAAIELMKAGKGRYRIEVKPENISMTDFSSLKNERLEVLAAIAQFIQTIGPLVEVLGQSALPVLLKMLKVTLSGLKGSSAYESLIDDAIRDFEKAQAQAAANPQQPPPDPKLQAEQMKAQVAQAKGQMDIQKEQMKHQHKLVEIQAETQARAMEEQVQRENNVQEAAQKQMVTNALKPPEPPKPIGGKR
jgi:hypothetical protein